MFVIYIVPNLTYLVMKYNATFSKKKMDAYEYEQMRNEKDKQSPKDGRQSVGNFGDDEELDEE